MKALLLAPFLILGIPNTSVASEDISFKVNYKTMSDEFNRSIINANKAKKNNNIDLLCDEISNSVSIITHNQKGLEKFDESRDWNKLKNDLNTKYIEYDCFYGGSKPKNAYYSIAMNRFKAEDYEGAIKELSEAIEIDSSVSKYFNLRGVSKYRLKDYQGAIDDYIKAIDLDPKDEVLYLNRGNALRTVGDYKGSISDFSKAIELKPEQADYYNARGFTKSRAGDKRGAISDYKKATELDPDEELYSENLAIAEEKLKQNEKAKKRKSIKNTNTTKTIVTPTPEQEATCLKAEDFKGCMEYYSQSPKRKGGTGKAILRAIGAGLSGANFNSSGYQSRPNSTGASPTPTLTPYNPKPPTFQKYSNEYNQMWNPR
tara:strand:- start:132 stop:1250 length:1119 start_codon:yes stop_codon:yes gene_type:complete